MRFRELSLLAYGPFTKLEIDLSARALHVLYGRNEAGKSTALRAVRGLLFGIDKNTPDAHLHAMKDLRVGATLEDDRGSLKVVRRKGNVNTLLDTAGEPIDEAVLRRMLGAVNEELFSRMFGLDHETLRRGAQAILLGKGDVGESIFGASLGREVSAVLRALKDEAEGLFAPNAHKRPLNEAIRAHQEAVKKARALEGSQALLTQQRGLEEAYAERAALEEGRRALAAKQSRLRRMERARPLVLRHRALVAQRAALGDVALLSDDAPRAREEVTREIALGAVDEERLTRAVRELETRRAALVVPEALLADAGLVQSIQSRAGGHKKATDELARVRADLAALEEEARALSKRLGAPDADKLRVDAHRQARIRKLALQPFAIEEKLRGAERLLAAKRASLESERARAVAATTSLADHGGDAGAFRRAAERALEHGDLEGAEKRLAAEAARLSEQASSKLASLGLFQGTLAEARRLAVPTPETCERFGRLLDEVAREEKQLTDQAAELARRSRATLKDLDAIDRAGAVPTEEELIHLRAGRDDAWAALKRAWVSGAELDVESAARYEREVGRADGVADRLRREAERVARKGALLAERDAGEREAERIEEVRAHVRRRQAELQTEFRETWREAGVEPRSPTEMRGWLSRHAALVSLAEQLSVVEAEHLLTKERLADRRSALSQLLSPATGESLALFAARAQERARAIDVAKREHEEALRAAATVTREIEDSERAKDEDLAELEAWREAWARETALLGVGEGATPEEVTLLLDELGELLRCVDAAEKLRRRVEVLEKEGGELEADVLRAARAHAPDLEARPVEEAADELVRRHLQGAAAFAERQRTDALLGETLASKAACEARGERARARLEELLHVARAANVEELFVAEQRSQRARDLDRQLAATFVELSELGPAEAQDELVAQDPDALEAELLAVEEELSELSRKHDALLRNIGALEKGAEDLKSTSAAAQAAAEAEEQLAKVRAYTDRYVRVKIAASVLAREIERFREKNQGPILTRASQLFRTLTLGAYDQLKVGYGDEDEAQLRCVRTGGTEVGVEALSDGTRDQLYLALRLASLERYVESNPPMPLVVDDILVHFDDERARAALAVLGEAAGKMQVILFTHHARVCELAAKAAPSAVVHALGTGIHLAAAGPQLELPSRG